MVYFNIENVLNPKRLRILRTFSVNLDWEWAIDAIKKCWFSTAGDDLGYVDAWNGE